jgi:DNA-binding transcriptional LysR family regulator
VLKDWQLPSLAIYAVYPQTSALPAKTRSLIDFLAERFGDHPYWDRDLP